MIDNLEKSLDKKILYIGGFELPDKNAAAQRVVGIAKALRELEYNVCFLNSIKNSTIITPEKKEYFGFECYEYRREKEKDYLFSAKTVLAKIYQIKPNIIIAYNYPAYALEKIRKYCLHQNIRCYVDSTEWYQAFGNNLVYRIIKNIDTKHRMVNVQKKMDGIIAISRYLYEYYKDETNTVIIPPIVDLNDEKWNIASAKNKKFTSFVYAGSPSIQKEKLDVIIEAIERVPSKYSVLLNVVGVTEKQFKEMYSWEKPISERVKFWGRVEHRKAIEIIKQSNWSVILRENNQVVKAGFPTKLVESISCGTPVIVNEFSNIKDYLDDTNSIMIPDLSKIDFAIEKALNSSVIVDNALFDYHRYLEPLKLLLS
ncbi:MAG: glycosyltransferase [Merdimonas faecis]|uniref:glycosyltransferase n=1 Tax=Merdimonas faecis TaxID=1653435 RepID=UPI0039904397